LLKAATSLGGGIGHEGDTCGALTGAVLSLGLYHQGGDRRALYRDAASFYNRFTRYYGSSKCRDIIGIRLKEGNNIRRFLYKGVICMGAVYRSIGWLFDLMERDSSKENKLLGLHDASAIPTNGNTDCSALVLQEISSRANLDTSSLASALSGFSGGICRQGDVCAALMTGILIVGLVHGNDPEANRLTRKQLLQVGWKIMQQGNRAFACESLHPSFAASRRAEMLYQDCLAHFGSADCKSIVENQSSPAGSGCCQSLAKHVSETTLALL